MTTSFEVAGRSIGLASPPFVIAEMSGNHNGSLERALEIVDAAAEAGAHAIKIQTYTAESMTLDVREREFVITDAASPWQGRTLFDLYQEAHTPQEWHGPIFERASAHGIIAFSTPFDESAVDFLEELRAPAYKIASFEIVHLPLIQRVAATGKPMFISTGMATLDEIDDAVRTARGAGCREIALFKCTSSYPASPEHSNVLAIPRLREIFGCEVGLSDHTMGVGAALAAVSHGATAIEKHFTLDRDAGGVDSAFSMEPGELEALVTETKRAWLALGSTSVGPTDAEKSSLVFRRSLYVAEDMQTGDVFTARNLRAIRPGHGLAPRHYDELIGRPVTRAVKRGTPLSWELVGDVPARIR